MELVIPMLKTWKSITHKVCYHTWNVDWALCKATGKFQPRKFSMGQILSFLQPGLDEHLALIALKGQIAAFVIIFQRLHAFHSLNKVFVREVAHTVSPVHSPVT